MGIGFRTFRRLLGTALLAMGAGGCASTANSHGVPIVPPHPGGLVQMEVYDRASGELHNQATYEKFVQARDAGKIPDAVKLYKDLPESSAYHAVRSVGSS